MNTKIYHKKMTALKKMQDFFIFEGIIMWNGVLVLKLIPRDENSLCSHILTGLRGFLYGIHPAGDHRVDIFVQIDDLFKVWLKSNDVSLEEQFLKELKRV